MTPEQRSAVRAGCNLATLPAEARAVLAAERVAFAERVGIIRAHAHRIYGLRKDRIKAERELGRLGDIQPQVRKILNKLISGSSK